LASATATHHPTTTPATGKQVIETLSLSYLESSVDLIESNNNKTRNTAKDNLAFLNWFFTVYSDFAGNDFWIAGESYAGVYVPTLAKLIVDTQFDLVNFKVREIERL